MAFLSETNLLLSQLSTSPLGLPNWSALQYVSQQISHQATAPSPAPGELVAIFTAPKKGQPMKSHQQIQAIAGEGLRGDRYATNQGAYSNTIVERNGQVIGNAERQVTLISLSAIEEANSKLQQSGVNPFSLAETRRNLVINTSSQDLLSLIGQEFTIAGVRMLGVEECKPCKRPTALRGDTKNGQAFEDAFASRGGIRAKILNNETLHVGDILRR